MSSIGLLTPSRAYKPHRYPWCMDAWKQQQQIHWLPEEVPLGEDVKDWAVNLTEPEKNLLTQIFRFFTQADIDVNDNYMDRYAQVFKPTEVKMMLSAFSNIETVHIAGYAHLLETIGMPDVEFQAFMEYEAMKDKHDFNLGFDTSSPSDTARTLAVFGAFIEGLQLFASFAMLMNFPRHNRMKGMGQIISWSVRDESLHAESMIKLYHTYVAEAGVNAQIEWLEPQLVRDCRKIVELEDKFIDLAFELGPVKGMTPDDIKAYIRFIADWRLRQLRLEPIYGVTENPLPWLQAMLSGFEFANFFESRATEYAKAATKGSWDGPDGVWAMFDEAQKKKAGG